MNDSNSAILETDENNISENVATSNVVKSTKSKGKKKKGKKKSNRQKIALERQNKLAEDYKSDQKKYDIFVDRIDKWFGENLTKIIGLFTEMDKEGTGEVTYDQFKACMLDYNIPCDLIELHLLCRLLDTDGNYGIDFGEFEKGIRYFSDLSMNYRIVEAESSPYRDTDTTIHLLDNGQRRWIKCTVLLLDFEEIPQHPGHLEIMINPSYYIRNLTEIIKKTKGLTSNCIDIFRSNPTEGLIKLPHDHTLADLGFRGGDYYKPKDLTLFYDFDPGIGNCPLILNEI